MGNNAFPQEIGLYLHFGLTPIPLKPQPKERLVRWEDGWNPTRKGWERWFANLKTDVGVRCGEILTVIDCDSADALLDFSSTYDLPSSYLVAKTGRDYHIWVKPREPIRMGFCQSQDDHSPSLTVS